MNSRPLVESVRRLVLYRSTAVIVMSIAFIPDVPFGECSPVRLEYTRGFAARELK